MRQRYHPGYASKYDRHDALMVGWFMVFNATFNNIAVISWLSDVLVVETRVPVARH